MKHMTLISQVDGLWRVTCVCGWRNDECRSWEDAEEEGKVHCWQHRDDEQDGAS